MKLTKLILILFVTCYLVLVTCYACFAQELSVDGDIDTSSLMLTPTDFGVEAVSGADEAKICYDLTEQNVYISREAAAWEAMGAIRNVATIIVAASDSLTSGKADIDYRCDGTADQVEIQKAIDDLPSSGGAVYLLEGTYSITGSINITGDNISLIGAGKGTVLQVAAGASGSKVIYAYGVAANHIERILISQLMIDGNSGVGSFDGIQLEYVDNSRIDKVCIENMAEDGIDLDYSINNIISNNTIANNGDEGMDIENSCDNNIISNNTIKGNDGDGIEMSSVSGNSNNIIANNNIQGSGADLGTDDGHGIIISGGSSNNIISNNNIQDDDDILTDDGLDGIMIASGADNTIISGNNIQNTGAADDSGDGIEINSDSNIISGNSIQGPDGDDGIELSGASDNVVFGNNIRDNRNDGIQFYGSANNNIISSNRISDSTDSGYGIDISPDPDDSSITGNSNYLVANYIDGTAYNETVSSGKIKDSGTNTKYTGKDKLTIEPITIDLNTGDSIDPSLGEDPLDNLKGGPSSHIVLKNTSASDPLTVVIENGKAAGDLLILEGTDDAKRITIEDDPATGNTNLGANRTLGKYDTLELIWNGTKWIEVSWTDY